MGRKNKKIKRKPPIKTQSPRNITFGEREPEDILHEWPRPKQKVPQIFVHQPIDFRQHIYKLLTEEKVQFYEPHESRYYIKINCQSFRDHMKITEYLDKCQIPFHTYGFPKKRKLKVIVKGLSTENDLKEVAKALNAASIPVIRINYLNTKKRTPDTSVIILITVPHNEKGRKLLNVTKIFDKDVKLERPLPKSKQCYRCLKWGHAQRYCHGAIRCVKCAGKHWYNNCHKDRTIPPKCANCGQTHVASYRQCAYCPDSIQYKNGQSKKMENKKRTPPAPSTAPQLLTVDNYLFLRRTKDDPTPSIKEAAPGDASLPVNILGTAHDSPNSTTTGVTRTTTTEDISHEAVLEVKLGTPTTSKDKPTSTSVRKDEHVAETILEVEPGASAVSKVKSDAAVALKIESGTATASQGEPDAAAFSKIQTGAATISKIKPGVSAAPKDKPGTGTVPKIKSGTSATPEDEPSTDSKIKPGGETVAKMKTGTVVAPEVKSGAATVSEFRPDTSAAPEVVPGASAVSKIKSDELAAPTDKSDTATVSKSKPSASPEVVTGASAVSKIKSDVLAAPTDEPGTATVFKSKPSAAPTVATDTSAVSKIRSDASVAPKHEPGTASLSKIKPPPKVEPSATAVSKVKPSPAAIPIVEPGVASVSKIKALPKVEPSVTAVSKIKPSAAATPVAEPGVASVSKIKTPPKVEPSATAVSKIKPSAAAAPAVESGVASVSKIKPNTSPAAKDTPGATKTTPKSKPGTSSAKVTGKSPKSAQKSRKKRK